MTYEELAELKPGDTVSLDLCDLWQRGYGGVEDYEIPLIHEGYLSLEIIEDEEEDDGIFDPEIDLYTDKGMVASDSETCTVIAVDAEAGTIELQGQGFDDSFVLDLEDAAYCVCPYFW